MTDYCNDYGSNPLCRKEVDSRYTMDFSDVMPGERILWCSYCGPKAAAIDRELKERCNDPMFVDKLRSLVESAEKENERH